jgi:LysR family transcriptional regulator for metE and metH
MQIDSRDLLLVKSIAELGSLTSAAKTLHVTQSAVSQRLSSLQGRTGVSLFYRENGVMRVTPAGQRLIEAAQLVSSELDSVQNYFQNLNENRKSRLRLTTQCYTLYRWLPFVIRDLHHACPGLSADVVPEATDRPYDALKQDEIDIALVSNPQIIPGHESHPLFDDELYAVMSSTHSLASRSYLNPSNFSDQTLVLYSGTEHAILNEVLNPAAVVPKRVIQVRITEAIVELVRSGQGIAVLAGWAFNDIDHSGLTAIRITRTGMKRQWRAVVGQSCNSEHAEALLRSVRRVGKVLNNPSWRNSLQQEQ